MSYKVKIKNKVQKNIKKMPAAIQESFTILLEDLRSTGPTQPAWANYSKLGKNEFHCHLSHRWVACWRNEKKSIIIEVYYAGSREKAPY